MRKQGWPARRSSGEPSPRRRTYEEICEILKNPGGATAEDADALAFEVALYRDAEGEGQ